MAISEPASLQDPDGDLLRTVSLSERDVREAARLMELLVTAADSGFGQSAFGTPREGEASRDDLIATARMLLNNRRARCHHFNSTFFGEPAWDIMLVLYITDVSGDRQTIGKLAAWIATPPTTVLRWVGLMEMEGLVERQAHPTDRRSAFIRLTANGRKSLESFLRQIPN